MDNSTFPDSHPPNSSWILYPLSLFVVASVLLLVGLGDVGLTDRDEGSNAEAAREMLETGNWISPTLNYEPRFAKPAFVYWIISGSYALLGVNEFSARFPSALFGIALILLQYGFLSKIYGPRLGLFGALMLLLNVEVIAINRMVLTDPELVFFTTLAGYSFWLGINGKGQHRSYFMGFYIGMALAMLAKGPVGMIIPLLAVVPYLTMTGMWKKFWKDGYPLRGTLIFLMIAMPWYVAMFMIHGAEYVAAAQANTTGRFANPMEGHGGTTFFYIPVLLLGFFPWSGFLPAALYDAVKDWKKYKSGQRIPTAEQDLGLFAGLWVVGIFVFFTFSSTRLPHYIYPLFPAASVLTALFWSRCVRNPNSPGLIASVRTFVIVGYLFGFALAAAPAIYHTFISEIAKEFPAAVHVDLGLTPVVLGAVVLLGTIVVRSWIYSDEKRSKAFWVSGGMMVFLALVVILLELPRFSTFFIAPPQALATIAGYNLGPNDRFIQFGRKRPSLAFYAKRKFYHMNPGENEKFDPHLNNAQGRNMVVLQSRLRSQLPPVVSDYPVVLQRYGFSLLSNESLIK